MKTLLRIAALALLVLLSLLYLWTEGDEPYQEAVWSESEPKVEKYAAEQSPAFPGTLDEFKDVRSNLSPDQEQYVSEIRLADLEPFVPEESSSKHNHIVAQWRGRLEPTIDGDLLNGKDNGVMTIRMPDGGAFNLRINRHIAHSDDRGSYLGKVQGQESSRVLLSYSRDAVFGSISIFDTDEVWEIRNGGDGEQIFARIDVSEIGNCGLCAEGGSK